MEDLDLRTGLGPVPNTPRGGFRCPTPPSRIHVLGNRHRFSQTNPPVPTLPYLPTTSVPGDDSGKLDREGDRLSESSPRGRVQLLWVGDTDVWWKRLSMIWGWLEGPTGGLGTLTRLRSPRKQSPLPNKAVCIGRQSHRVVGLHFWLKKSQTGTFCVLRAPTLPVDTRNCSPTPELSFLYRPDSVGRP